MNYQTKELKATQQLLEKFKFKKPVCAVQEIIWNSIDADSDKIIISIQENSLGLIENISIKDNGEGFSENNLDTEITQISFSSKNSSRTKKGRIPHGKRGTGMYAIAHLGDVTWKTNYAGESLQCSIDLMNRQVNFHKPEISTDPGTIVEISNLIDTYGLTFDTIREHIILNTLLDIELYKITIKINDEDIEIKDIYSRQENYTDNITINEKSYKLSIKLFEINNEKVKNASKIFILGSDNTVLDESEHRQKGLGKPIAVYIIGNEFPEDFTPIMDSLEKLKEISRKHIKNFVKQYEDENKRNFIKDLEEQKILPEKLRKQETILNETEKQEKILVKEVLYEIHKLKGLKFTNEKERKTSKLLAELIYHCGIREDDVITSIIEDVFQLTENERKEFHDVLTKYSLKGALKMLSTINHRLQIISYLELLFSKKSPENNRIKERSQLQKFLNQNIWILSEDFEFYISDQSLTTWAKQAADKLGVDIEDFNFEIKDAATIPDFIICRSNKGREDHYYNLLIEIKRPNYKLERDSVFKETQDYLEAIKNIAAANKLKTDWEMWFLVTEIDPLFKGWKDKEKGLVQIDDTYKIYIKTWAEIIQQKKSSLEYLKNELRKQNNLPNNEVDISFESAENYVLNKYPFMKLS